MKKKKKETALTVYEKRADIGKDEGSIAPDDGKMTIYDYEQKYVKRQNAKTAKFLVRFLAALVGVFLFTMLFFVSWDVYEKNAYAGYAVGAVCLLIYLFVFLIPLFKIMRSSYFVTNVNVHTARAAQKHNKKLRHDIADKIIDLTAKVQGAGWYDSQTVGKLAVALKAGKEDDLRKTLTELYNGSVKKTAKDIIFKSSLKSAAYSAVSQGQKLDAALVVIVNVQLVKDLIFLYGFRPSDAKLLRIFGRVLQNSLIAYGLGGVQIGNSVARTMGDAVRDIPILGTAVAAVVDSSVQGLVNGTLTTVIGYQTIKYLSKEYKLQDILDGIDVTETQEEFNEACSELEQQLKKRKKLSRAV